MNIKNIIILTIIFISINIAVYKITEVNSKNIIDLVLKEDMGKLQIHYDILNTSQKNISYAISQSIIRNSDLIKFLSASYSATEEQNKINREKLYIQLKEQYETAKKQGVLQLQFVNKNNISFLRLHKPSKFGDDLTEIREDYRIVNETKKPIRGFTQGRVAHGFRNTFPLFDKNKNHIGAMEISFSSENYQWYLNNVSHIHSHFLVNKHQFDAKTWERDGLVINYETSAESENLMLSLNDSQSKEKCIVNDRMKLEPYRKIIDEKIKEGEKFNFYTDYKNNIEIVSFLPIKNLSNQTVAWIVSHTKSDIIKSSLNSTLIARIVVFLISIFIIYLLVRQINSNTKISETLNELNENKLFTDSILDNSGHAIITTNTDGVITLFNKKAENITGYKASEMIGKQTPAIFHYAPEVVERSLQFSNELGIPIEPGFDTFTIRCQYNLPNEFEWTYVRKDGEHVPVSLSISALRNDEGVITGYVGIAKDLSKIKEDQQKLIHSKQLLDEAQHLSAIGSWSLDIVKNRLEWSDEIFRIFEIDQSQFEPSYEGFLNAIHPEDMEMVQKAFSDSVANKTQYIITHRLLMNDGRVKYVTERGKTTYREDGTPLLSQGTVQDVTESRRVEKQLNDYVALIDESVITSSTDLDGNITYVSNAFCRVSKYEKSELIGQNHRIIRHPDMPAEIYQELWNTITHNQRWQGEIKNKAKDGSTYWVYAVISPDYDDNGSKRGYTAIRQDITSKKIAEELAITDRLTGLYNRLKLDEVLNYEIAQTSRYGTPLSIIIIDIDHFKSVNDTYGHQTGDMVLKEVAQILRSCSRKSDTSGRWGGEEFLIILSNTNLAGALEAAEKIRIAIENYPFSVVGQKTASLGVSEFLANETENSFIERADQALYRAKSGGRNQVVG